MNTMKTEPESKETLLALADAYWDSHFEKFTRDLARLVAIPGVEDPTQSAPGAPFGPEPARALEATLDIAREMGFEAVNEEGYVGYVDFPGASDKQIGIIGHVDVVPAGDGWERDPFTLTEKDGYFVGRGVSDDKGPVLLGLHAMKCWKDALAEGRGGNFGNAFPYSLRFIVGANEETKMGDVAYYRAHHQDPAFLFTPDAGFPVSYGEKGIYQATLVSAPIEPGRGIIADISGGEMFNAVPSFARARFRDELIPDMECTGVSAHASTPENGVSAIHKLILAILGTGCCSNREYDFLTMARDLSGDTTGAGACLACSDEDFGALTLVCGKIYYRGGRICLTVDVRYPTTITAREIHRQLGAMAGKAGGMIFLEKNEDPFLIRKDSPAVNALLQAYREVTGEANAEPFTMGGGTYARKFSCGVSFGPEFPEAPLPEWSGGMHGKNEAMSISQMKRAFEIYVLTIARLMESEL